MRADRRSESSGRKSGPGAARDVVANGFGLRRIFGVAGRPDRGDGGDPPSSGEATRPPRGGADAAIPLSRMFGAEPAADAEGTFAPASEFAPAPPQGAGAPFGISPGSGAAAERMIELLERQAELLEEIARSAREPAPLIVR